VFQIKNPHSTLPTGTGATCCIQVYKQFPVQLVCVTHSSGSLWEKQPQFQNCAGCQPVACQHHSRLPHSRWVTWKSHDYGQIHSPLYCFHHWPM